MSTARRDTLDRSCHAAMSGTRSGGSVPDSVPRACDPIWFSGDSAQDSNPPRATSVKTRTCSNASPFLLAHRQPTVHRKGTRRTRWASQRGDLWRAVSNATASIGDDLTTKDIIDWGRRDGGRFTVVIPSWIVSLMPRITIRTRRHLSTGLSAGSEFGGISTCG